MARRALTAANSRWHRTWLTLFATVVVVHWLEHLAQAAQIWMLGLPRPDSRGLLGQAVPWLATHEWLHYGFAIVMLVAFAVLLPGFRGVSRWFWIAALGLQFWHHIEHFVLLAQSVTATPWFGRDIPTSFAQLVVPRVELHLLYNGIVTIPMLLAMRFHMRPPARERAEPPACTCARHAPARVAVAA